MDNKTISDHNFNSFFSYRSITLPNQRQKWNRGNPLTIMIWLTSEAIDWPKLHKRRVHKVLNRPTHPILVLACYIRIEKKEREERETFYWKTEKRCWVGSQTNERIFLLHTQRAKKFATFFHSNILPFFLTFVEKHKGEDKRKEQKVFSFSFFLFSLFGESDFSFFPIILSLVWQKWVT